MVFCSNLKDGTRVQEVHLCYSGSGQITLESFLLDHTQTLTLMLQYIFNESLLSLYSIQSQYVIQRILNKIRLF